MSFYCQRTRLHSSWAELSSGRTDGWSDGRMAGLTVMLSSVVFKCGSCCESGRRSRRWRRRRRWRWRRRQLRLRCRRTRQCQFMPPKWKSKLKDLCTRCGTCVCVCVAYMYATHGTHTHTYMHMYYLLYFSWVNVIYMKISASATTVTPLNVPAKYFASSEIFKLNFHLLPALRVTSKANAESEHIAVT